MKQKTYTVPMAVLIALFFMWGFITCMNDILIPHLKELFQLNYSQAMLVQFAFFGAYFVGSVLYFAVSYFYGDPINKIGYKGGIIGGLLISAIGCMLFYPAETLGIYALFLTALFTLGIGFTLLQISANPYVAILGAPEGASSRLNLAQAFNSLGTTIAPILGGYLIFEFFGQEIRADATKIPYLIFGLVFVAFAFIVYFVHLPEIAGAAGTEKLGALSYPQLKGGILAIFFYVGAEVAIGSLIINFIALPEILGVGEHVAKNYLALYWGGAMIGRFLGAISLNTQWEPSKKAIYMAGTALAVFLLIFNIISLSFADIWKFTLFMGLNFLTFLLARSLASRTLIVFSLVNIALLIATIVLPGEWAIWCVLSIGLFNSIMWSNIFTLSISGLGPYTSQGSSLLIMGILGGALLPLVQGALADAWGLRLSFAMPILCYAYILAYGWFCLRKFGNQNSGATIGH